MKWSLLTAIAVVILVAVITGATGFGHRFGRSAGTGSVAEPVAPLPSAALPADGTGDGLAERKLPQISGGPAVDPQVMISGFRLSAAVNPARTAEVVSELPDCDWRRGALSAVAVVWANADAGSAVEWALALPEGPERRSLLETVAYEAVRSDPVASLCLAAELPAGRDTDMLVRHSLLQWAAFEPELAAEWAVDHISNPILRRRVLSEVATAWSDSDPAAAVRLAAGAIPAGREQDDAVIGIVQRWVQRDPERALEWVTRLPEGGLKLTALANLAGLWPSATAVAVPK